MDRQAISHEDQSIHSPEEAVQSWRARTAFCEAVKHDLGVRHIEVPGSQLVTVSGAAAEFNQERRDLENIDVLVLLPREGQFDFPIPLESWIGRHD